MLELRQMLEYLLTALLISIGINLLLFIFAFKFKTDKLTDFSYALSFVVVSTTALVNTGNYNLPNILMASYITLWTLRLGTYLVIRIKKWGRDRRFDPIRNNFRKFLTFWVFQAITVWVVSLATLQFYKLNNLDKLGTYNLIGAGIFFLGLAIETTGDIQLFKFSNQPKNKGKFINQGLWKFTRHPNYLGEITLWFGLWIFTLPALTNAQAILGFISPLFIFLMIRFVSGVPKLEKSAAEKWGKDKAYQEYRNKTGLILPFKLSRKLT